MADTARDVVLGTHLTLSRNLSGFPFPPHYRFMDAPQGEDVLRCVEEAFIQAGIRGEYARLSLEGLNRCEISALTEGGWIEPGKPTAAPSGDATQPYDRRAVLMRRDQRVAACVNDRDHLRIVAVNAGFTAHEAFGEAYALDSVLGRTLHYAFDRDFGYLTAHPINAGTGLRLRVRLHTPALCRIGKPPLAQAQCEELRVGLGRVRNESAFEIMNAATIGLTETDILEAVEVSVRLAVAQERAARETLLLSHKEAWDQELSDALKLAATAAGLEMKAFHPCWSTLRLGVVAGVLPLALEDIDALYTLTQPGHMDVCAGREQREDERAITRARLLRELLESAGIIAHSSVDII